MIGFQPAAVTAIGQGENAGASCMNLTSRSFATLGGWQGAHAEWRVPLATLPADAAKVAVLVQQHGPGPIAGAASAAVPRT